MEQLNIIIWCLTSTVSDVLPGLCMNIELVGTGDACSLCENSGHASDTSVREIL